MRFAPLLAVCCLAQAQIPAQDSRNTETPNTDTHFKAKSFATLAEWQDHLANLDVCFGRVNTLPEAFAHPVLIERGMIRRDIQLRDLIMVFKTIQLGLTALWAVEGPPFRATESTVRQEMKLFCKGLEAKL